MKGIAQNLAAAARAFRRSPRVTLPARSAIAPGRG